MKKIFGINKNITVWFVALLGLCALVLPVPAFADTTAQQTSSTTATTPAKPKMTEQEALRLHQKHEETKNKIFEIKLLETKEKNKLIKNQQSLEKTKNDLEYSKQRYTSTKSRLSDIEADLAVAVSAYNSTLSQVRKRVRTIYKHHRKNLFEMILTSENINEMMDSIYFQNIITKSDKNSLYNVRKNAQRIAQIRYKHEMEKRRLANSIQDMNSKQQAIEKAIGKNEQLIEKLRTDRHTYERAERELAAQSKDIAGLINRNTATSNTMQVVSGFIKPISGPITSPFGWRVHPIFKSRTFHSGIDIGGVFNGAIVASNSGKVIYAGWYGGYGKVVIIDHGMYNGAKITTLYAHMNSWNVSVGQYVTRGQIIGREGSTGYSTGPHCHFEVRVNGQPRNPMQYI